MFFGFKLALCPRNESEERVGGYCGGECDCVSGFLQQIDH